ncbi:MAG: SpoIID/LytB domain-containing protein [Deltaproteobacteria bacterium]|nr:SpoIID/LytB domain-containing protein [Deltaproteobacteria bacterium]
MKKNLNSLTVSQGDYVIKTRGGEVVSLGDRTVSLRAREGSLLEGEKRFGEELVLVSRVPVSIDGVLYSGRVVFHPTEAGIDLIDQVNVERYVASVLKSEIPTSFAFEAKKAIAIAVRSYTLYRMKRAREGHYHLDNSNISQVYRGVDGIEDEFVRAAEETRGMVVTYGDEPALTVYHAICGGYTENAYDVWQTDMNYLRSVSCGYCNDSSGFRWALEIIPEDFMGLLKKGEVEGERLISLRPGARTRTGRVRTLMVSTDTGTWEIPSSRLRADIGYALMKSTNFSVKMREGMISLSGKGYGHGVGLCQYGADGMANRGFGFVEILRHYYGKEIEIDTFY